MSSSDEEKERKPLRPTLLGKIVARHQADPVVANDLLKALSVSGDLDMAIENYTNLLYELRLFLIANDHDEQMYAHRATYQVETEEFLLLQHYDISEDMMGDPPNLEKVIEARMKIKEKDLHEKYLQIKELIERSSKNV